MQTGQPLCQSAINTHKGSLEMMMTRNTSLQNSLLHWKKPIRARAFATGSTKRTSTCTCSQI